MCGLFTGYPVKSLRLLNLQSADRINSKNLFRHPAENPPLPGSDPSRRSSSCRRKFDPNGLPEAIVTNMFVILSHFFAFADL